MGNVSSLKIDAGTEILLLCVLLDEKLNIHLLDDLGALMAGMPSIYNAPKIIAGRDALHLLRMRGFGFETKLGIDRAIDRYLAYCHDHGIVGPYTIDPRTYAFSRSTTYGGSVLLDRMRDVLAAIMAPTRYVKGQVDFTREYVARLKDGSDLIPITINPVELGFPQADKHDFDRTPAGPIRVPLAELITLAKEMDEADKLSVGRRRGYWHGRITRARLQSCSPSGLKDTEYLDLAECKHLIGVPGVGKTSLLTVLARWFDKKGLRILLLFPTLEVARQYLVDLRFYGAKASILTGQSEGARNRHASSLADNIAAQYGQGGFGNTVEGSDLMGVNCLLPAFAVGSTSRWPYGQPACESLYQPQLNKDGTESMQPLHVECPYFSPCGRYKAQRELVNANVWVAHYKSLDTAMKSYVSPVGMRFLEYISRHFDLVVFDEADAVQQGLDNEGATKMDLAGIDEALIPSTLAQMTVKLAGSRNDLMNDQSVRDFDHAGQKLTSMTMQFQKLVQRLLRENQPQAVNDLKRQFLTPQSIIHSMMKPERKQVLTAAQALRAERRRRAVATFWELAATAAFDDSIGYLGREQAHPRSEALQALGLSASAATKLMDKMRKAMDVFLRTQFSDSEDKALNSLCDDLALLCFGKTDAQVKQLDARFSGAARILTGATFVAIAYRRLVKSSANLPPELAEAHGFEQAPSPWLARHLPESLLGSVTGLRFEISESPTRRDRPRIEMQYLAMKGLPRMQMLLFHRLFEAEQQRAGPAVLLVSATSFMEHSPSYHLAHGPHYLLRHAQPRVAKGKSVWAFFPIKDPNASPGSPAYLRFSGGGRTQDQRDAALKAIVRHLVGTSRDRSEIYKQIDTFDIRNGVKRKAALIVNSYEQASKVKKWIGEFSQDIGSRTRAVVKPDMLAELGEGHLSSSQVESFGDDETCDILVFPIAAIGRGVNIVRTTDLNNSDAALGTLYFLTRPHPPDDDTGLLLGLAGRAGQEFAEREFDAQATYDVLRTAYKAAKSDLRRAVGALLREPLRASKLPPHLWRAFTANMMVAILQTVGRATRNDCPVQVFFVDAAWAPKSAVGGLDTPNTSMLLQMQAILRDLVNHSDPLHREIYQILYGDFEKSLSEVQGLIGRHGSGAAASSNAVPDDEEEDVDPGLDFDLTDFDDDNDEF